MMVLFTEIKKKMCRKDKFGAGVKNSRLREMRLGGGLDNGP